MEAYQKLYTQSFLVILEVSQATECSSREMINSVVDCLVGKELKIKHVLCSCHLERHNCTCII